MLGIKFLDVANLGYYNTKTKRLIVTTIGKAATIAKSHLQADHFGIVSRDHA